MGIPYKVYRPRQDRYECGEMKNPMTRMKYHPRQTHLVHAIHGGYITLLVGGFNPSEKYQSKWESSSSRGFKKIFKTTALIRYF